MRASSRAPTPACGPTPGWPPTCRAATSIAADPSTLPLTGRRVVRLELPGPGRPTDPERDLARLRREGVKWVIVSGDVTDRVLAARDRYPRETALLRAARSRPEARLRRLPERARPRGAVGAGLPALDRYRCRDEPRAPHRPRHRRRCLPLRRRPARARDHGQPGARADLRQLALRLGLADRDRPHGARDRLLGGGIVADRLPSPYLLVSVLTLGAVLVALVPVIDETCSTWIVDWDPGPRLDPLLAAAILFGPASVVLASASPIAVRLAASSLERLGRTAGRLFSISTAGSIFGTFVTAFWLVPELGTDQVLAVGAVTLVAAALIVALAVRLVPAAVVLAGALAGGGRPGGLARARRQQQLKGVAAQNWSPLYRQRETARRGRSIPRRSGRSARPSRFARRATRVPPARRGRRQRLALPPLRQLLPERDVALDPYRTRFPYTDYLDLGLAHQPVREERALHRPRRRLGAEADVARLPRAAAAGRRARSGGRRCRVPLVRAPAQPPAHRRRRRRRQWLDAPSRSAGT